MPKQTNQRSLFLRHGSRLCDVTPPHPGTDTDGRCFRLNVGRTVLSSSTNTGELAEVELRNEGRLPGLEPATAGADTDRGISTCQDIPSRSENSVFTPANERRKSAHCAGVVTSAAKSSRRSAASFARKRAARARARGVDRSCWTGKGLRVGGIGIDAPHLVVDPETRTVGLGVARTDADADINVHMVNSAEGTKGAKVMSDVIS
ncbi:hypothetical protein F5888DRAFT_1712577 [Russula emetica]|nr:hypothetical protein F5888DRAFT_1712577 [Russula emetica]